MSHHTRKLYAFCDVSSRSSRSITVYALRASLPEHQICAAFCATKLLNWFLMSWSCACLAEGGTVHDRTPLKRQRRTSVFVLFLRTFDYMDTSISLLHHFRKFHAENSLLMLFVDAEASIVTIINRVVW